MDIVYYLILLAVLLVGWFINIVGLPGLWLMVAALGIYGLVTGWNTYVGWPSLIWLVVLGALAEVVEFVAGAAGSKAAGGRKRGMIGAIVGGFLGAIFLSVIPIPIVAQVVGACLGAFIGAAVMEFTDKDAAHSIRVGIGAAKGRFWGIVSKLAFGLPMFIIAAWAALPYQDATPIAAPTIVMPSTTAPATTTTAPTTLPS
jgi:uncharacterized protein YqgC (DUF456 family)